MLQSPHAIIDGRAVPISAAQWARDRHGRPLPTASASRPLPTASAPPPVQPDYRAVSRASMLAEAQRQGLLPKTAAAPTSAASPPSRSSGAVASIPGDHRALSRANMIAQIQAAGMTPKL